MTSSQDEAARSRILYAVSADRTDTFEISWKSLRLSVSVSCAMTRILCCSSPNGCTIQSTTTIQPTTHLHQVVHFITFRFTSIHYTSKSIHHMYVLPISPRRRLPTHKNTRTHTYAHTVHQNSSVRSNHQCQQQFIVDIVSIR
jgi:hypothetical protein